MTTYFVTVGSNEYKVDITENQFLVNGEPMDMKLRQLNEQGLYLLQQGTRQLEMVMRPKENNQVSVMVGRRNVMVQVAKREGLRSNSKHSAGNLSAPMPGTIIHVNVAEGHPVDKGDVIVVMESMKMQMEIRTPVAGMIHKINVKPGMKVEKGFVLAQVVE